MATQLSALWRVLALVLFVLAGGVLPAQWTIPADPPSGFELDLYGPEEAQFRPEGPLVVEGTGSNTALQRTLKDMAFRSRERLFRNAPVDWRGTARVVWVENEADFLRETGFRPEHTAAAASPGRMVVWINASSWQRSSYDTQQEVMTHELAHLLVGSLPASQGPRRLPLWFEEGMVQRLAGELSPEGQLALMQAHFFGRVPRLADLETRFPRDPAGQQLAYATAERAVGEIAASYGSGRVGTARLLRRLADREEGPRLARKLWDPLEREEIHALALQSLGSRFIVAFVLLGSHTVIWIFVAVAVVFAFVVLRRRRAAWSRQEMEEEPWLESLTDEDVEDIYGDREGRWGEVEETPWERHQREKEERGLS